MTLLSAHIQFLVCSSPSLIMWFQALRTGRLRALYLPDSGWSSTRVARSARLFLYPSFDGNFAA
jgi:hypothetical protein